ncbi:MAG: transcriptional regulator [Myxococcota bacterium]
MIETVTRKRIEILVDTPLVPLVIRHVKAADISGWSVLHVDRGGGRDAEWQHDEVTGASAKAIVLVIAGEAKASALVESLAPILDSHRLFLAVGEVEVVRGDRY